MDQTNDHTRNWDGKERRSTSRIDDEFRARKLLQKYRGGGPESAAARDALVLQFRPLVQKQARQFLTSNVPFEDLVQEGFLGLMNGIDRYDPDRGAKLITYATHHIDGHLRHFLRDRVQIIKEPAWLQEIAQKVKRQSEALTQEYGRVPSDAEVASSLGLAESEITRIHTTRPIFAVSSLDEAQETGSQAAHATTSNTQTSQPISIEDRVVLESALVRLKEIEQKVLYSFYYEDRSQTDIAHALGVSNNYISHILKNSARKLQQMFRSDAVREAALQHERMRRRAVMSTGDYEREEFDGSSSFIIDKVTELYTVDYFKQRVDEELSRAIRHDLELSLVRVLVSGDLHEASQFVQVANAVKSCTRRSDLVARTDTHEISALLPHTGKMREVVCSRLRLKLGEIKDRLPNACDLSIGTASYPEFRQRDVLFQAAIPSETIAGLLA